MLIKKFNYSKNCAKSSFKRFLVHSAAMLKRLVHNYTELSNKTANYGVI